MDFSRLYYMGCELRRGVYHYHVGRDLAQKGPQVLRGEVRVPLVRPTLESGTRPADLMIASALEFKFLSPAFQSVLQGAGGSGWDLYPVELPGRDGTVLAGYAGLIVRGRAGPLDKSRGLWRRYPPPVPTGRAFEIAHGAWFEPSSWDGSDVFVPAGTTLVCVTERVRDAIAAAKLNNITLDPLTEFPVNRRLAES